MSVPMSVPISVPMSVMDRTYRTHGTYESMSNIKSHNFYVSPRRKTLKVGHLLTALTGVFSIPLAAQAQGIIIPRPCLRPEVRCPPPMEVPQRPLKVKSIRFTAKITDQV